MAKEISEGQAWKYIDDLFGGEAVFHPNQVQIVDIIRTGSPELDSALAIGGWPRGRLIHLAGAQASGKTLLAMIAMAEWQSQDPENCCIFIDAEYTYDPKWARKLGVDNDRVMLIKTNKADKIITGLIGKTTLNSNKKEVHTPGLFDFIVQGQKVKQKIEDKVINLNLGKVGVIVLDSIATMEVPMETVSEAGKQNIAALARFLSAELKKLTPGISLANVAMIVINQVRVKIGEYGNPEGSPGGKALYHACSFMVQVAPISGKDAKIFDSNGEKIGHRIRTRVTKNKLAPPFKEAEIWVQFNKGVVRREEEVLRIACKHGLMERPNNRTYVVDDEKLTSKELALTYIKEHLAEIEDRTREVYLNQLFDLSEDDEQEDRVAINDSLDFGLELDNDAFDNDDFDDEGTFDDDFDNEDE